MHFGIITTPVPGHMNPLCALGRELKRRGHRVTVFSILDTQEKIAAEGLDFAPIGEQDFPPGIWEKYWAPRSAQPSRLSTARYLAKLHVRIAEMTCRDVPAAARRLAIEALVVDSVQFQGRAIADHLGLPFASVSCSLVINRDVRYRSPPPFTGWGHSGGSVLARVRNRAGWLLFDWLVAPVVAAADRAAAGWGLPAYGRAERTYSPLIQIVPMPKEFDFPAEFLQPNVHYVGSLVDERPGGSSFPWEKLDGRPLVYASLGTIQNRHGEVFAAIARACQGLDAQLVVALGDWRGGGDLPELPGRPLVISYAPQLELLKRAALCVTHAGANTVYEALTYGVPMVAIPFGYDQPAVAARIRRAGVGVTLDPERLDAPALRLAIERALGDPSYRRRARAFQSLIEAAGGVKRAAELVEDACRRAIDKPCDDRCS